MCSRVFTVFFSQQWARRSLTFGYFIMRQSGPHSIESHRAMIGSIFLFYAFIRSRQWNEKSAQCGTISSQALLVITPSFVVAKKYTSISSNLGNWATLSCGQKKLWKNGSMVTACTFMASSVHQQLQPGDVATIVLREKTTTDAYFGNKKIIQSTQLFVFLMWPCGFFQWFSNTW